MILTYTKLVSNKYTGYKFAKRTNILFSAAWWEKISR